MTDNKSKIALVTGSSKGLGKNTALALAKKGVDVVVTYHSNQAEAESVVAAIEEVGVGAIALQLAEITEEQFDTMMNIHVIREAFFSSRDGHQAAKATQYLAQAACSAD